MSIAEPRGRHDAGRRGRVRPEDGKTDRGSSWYKDTLIGRNDEGLSREDSGSVEQHVVIRPGNVRPEHGPANRVAVLGHAGGEAGSLEQRRVKHFTYRGSRLGNLAVGEDEAQWHDDGSDGRRGLARARIRPNHTVRIGRAGVTE